MSEFLRVMIDLKRDEDGSRVSLLLERDLERVSIRIGICRYLRNGILANAFDCQRSLRGIRRFREQREALFERPGEALILNVFDAAERVLLRGGQLLLPLTSKGLRVGLLG